LNTAIARQAGGHAGHAPIAPARSTSANRIDQPTRARRRDERTAPPGQPLAVAWTNRHTAAEPTSATTLVPNRALRRLAARHLQIERLEHASVPLHLVAFDLLSGRAVQPTRASTSERASGGVKGLKSIGLHECRHTYASLMIAAGVSAKALQTFMGHSSITTAYDRYGHLMPDTETQWAIQLQEFLDAEALGTSAGKLQQKLQQARPNLALESQIRPAYGGSSKRWLEVRFLGPPLGWEPPTTAVARGCPAARPGDVRGMRPPTRRAGPWAGASSSESLRLARQPVKRGVT
jgi:hypothetical protein